MSDAALVKPARRKWPWMVFRVALSCAALGWVLHVTPLDAVVRALQSADLLLLVVGVFMNVSTRIAAAERTWVMNRGMALSVSRWQTLETVFISNFYALLSPGPMLSGVVTVYRYKSYGASITGGVSSLLASRGIECAAFIGWGFACALIDPRISAAAIRFPMELGAIGLFAMAIGIVVWWFLHKLHSARAAERSKNVSESRHPMLAKIMAVWTQILAQGPAVAFKALVPASVQVMVSGAALMVLARSLQIEISWITGIWISAAVYGVMLLPISIAGLGVREFTLMKSFALLGFAPRAAVAVSVLLFLDQVVSALIGGVLQISSVIVRARAQS
jgi:glycosyltransferase 2 family protein